jgi:dihydrodipicolinate synthase/N-acetylneuraminate lyase
MIAHDAQTLRGLWAAIPTPWDACGALDTDMLSRNVERLAASNVDGIYTTDSDGEFYAIELDEFEKLAECFGKATRECNISAAVGVTWCNTQGIIDRIKASIDLGIPNVHVAFPFFMPLAKTDVDFFFEDLHRAAPQSRWIHYAHPRCGPTLTGVDYARVHSRFPEQLIGTKLGTTDMSALAEILINAPMLAHFVVDPTLFPGMLLGARGCYSYWCNTLPRWHRSYMNACIEQDWNFARQCHLKLIQFELAHISPLRAAGHLHGIISKARAKLTGFLEDNGSTRAPYYPVASERLAELQSAFATFWKEELALENFMQAGQLEGSKR